MKILCVFNLFVFRKICCPHGSWIYLTVEFIGTLVQVPRPLNFKELFSISFCHRVCETFPNIWYLEIYNSRGNNLLESCDFSLNIFPNRIHVPIPLLFSSSQSFLSILMNSLDSGHLCVKTFTFTHLVKCLPRRQLESQLINVVSFLSVMTRIKHDETFCALVWNFKGKLRVMMPWFVSSFVEK